MAEIDQVIVKRVLDSGGDITCDFRPVIFKSFEDESSMSIAETGEGIAKVDKDRVYSGTSRKISCQFIYPVIKDLEPLEKLFSSMYRQYKSDGNSTPAGTPIGRFYFEFGKFTAVPIRGTIDNLKYTYLSANTLGNVPRQINGIVVPRYVELDFTLTVVHEKLRGFDEAGRILGTLWR